MARLPYPAADEMLESVASEVASFPPLNLIRMMAHSGALFGPWYRVASAILNDGALPPLLREISILRVAALSPGADYERTQHEAIARELGMSEQQIAGALSGNGLVGDDELVSEFTEEVVRNVSPSDETWGRLVPRFTPRQIIELLMVIGQYMTVARIAATTRIELDPPVGTALFDALR